MEAALTKTGEQAYSGLELRAISPFRYPGGKAFLGKYLASRVKPLSGERHYAEAFCGGAGAALYLLKTGAVHHLHLNDADSRIYSSWRAMIEEPERFVRKVGRVPLDMAHWYAANELVQNAASEPYSFDLGFATFYLNRTSRSGIVVGAGPIGGYDQTGKWKIDARFNRPALSRRIRWLARQAERINLTNEDGLTFLSKSASRMPLDRTLFFIDPPYVKAGGRLYLNAMSEGKHIALSDIIQGQSLKHWVLTYDDHPLIRTLYEECDIGALDVSYSLQTKRRENEVLITPA